MNKKVNVTQYIIVVLLVLLLVVGGILVYQNYKQDNIKEPDVGTKDNNAENNNNDNSSNENLEKEISLDSIVIKFLSQRVIGIFTNNESSPYSDYYFMKDKIVMADEEVGVRLAISNFKQLDDYSVVNVGTDTVVTKVEEAIVKQAYEDIFDKSSYKIASFETDCGKKFTYSDGYYTAVSPDGCGGTSAEVSSEKLAYAKEVENNGVKKLEIYVYFFRTNTSTGEVYSDYKMTNLITTGEYADEKIFDDFTEKLGMYKYTFNQEKDENYVFISVERVK